MILAVNYLAEKYDIVKVVCKTIYRNELKLIYSHLINVIVDDYDNDKDISPMFGFNFDKFELITNEYDILLCGVHIGKTIINFPSDMYIHMELDYEEIFPKYFSLPNIEESKNILKKVYLYCDKFIFVHEQSSYGGISFEQYYNDIKDEILIINPDKNVYEMGHKYYDIAKYLIRLPMVYYIDIFKNCEKMYLMDSSYFNLIFFLNIECPKYVKFRNYDQYTKLINGKLKIDKQIFDKYITL